MAAKGSSKFPSVLSLIERLAPNTKDVAKWVKEVEKENAELSKEQLADFVGEYIVWQYTKQGALLALPGAVPGLGTILQIATEMGATAADLALLVRNQTYLVFAIAACYGLRGRKTLIQDSLICMGLWANALVLSKQGMIRVGNKVAAKAFQKRFPASVLRAINKKVGTTVLTKYGTKRGGVALGRLVPFGVGAAVGGGFNYLVMRRFKAKTAEYLRLRIASRRERRRTK